MGRDADSDSGLTDALMILTRTVNVLTCFCFDINNGSNACLVLGGMLDSDTAEMMVAILTAFMFHCQKCPLLPGVGALTLWGQGT